MRKNQKSKIKYQNLVLGAPEYANRALHTSLLSKIVLVGITALFLWALVLSPASAQIVPACGPDGTGPCTLCDLWKLGHNIINFLLWGLAIPVLTVLLLWGGTVWATSAGSPGRIEQGKKTMTTGLVGILIALSAWLVVDTIITTLAAEGEFKTAWNKFPDCAEPIKIKPADLPPVVSTEKWELQDCTISSGCDPNVPFIDGTFNRNNTGLQQNSESECIALAVSKNYSAQDAGGGKVHWRCVRESVVAVAPSGEFYSDTEARQALQSAGIQVKQNFCDLNQPLPPSQCPDPRPAKSGPDPGACTSLDRIPKSTIDKLKLIVGLTFYVSGGTETGHVTHTPCQPIVDVVPGTPGSPDYALLGTLLDAAYAVGAVAPNTRCETQGGSYVSSCKSVDGANHVHIKFLP